MGGAGGRRMSPRGWRARTWPRPRGRPEDVASWMARADVAEAARTAGDALTAASVWTEAAEEAERRAAEAAAGRS